LFSQRSVAVKRLNVGELARLFGLPTHIVVSLFKRGVIPCEQQYPGQHRTIAENQVPDVRRRLVEAGYLREER
jgi:hypothetical protein